MFLRNKNQKAPELTKSLVLRLDNFAELNQFYVGLIEKTVREGFVADTPELRYLNDVIGHEQDDITRALKKGNVIPKKGPLPTAHDLHAIRMDLAPVESSGHQYDQESPS